MVLSTWSRTAYLLAFASRAPSLGKRRDLERSGSGDQNWLAC